MSRSPFADGIRLVVESGADSAHPIFSAPATAHVPVRPLPLRERPAGTRFVMTEICPHQPATYASGVAADRCGHLPHLPRAVRSSTARSAKNCGMQNADAEFGSAATLNYIYLSMRVQSSQSFSDHSASRPILPPSIGCPQTITSNVTGGNRAGQPAENIW